VKTIQPTRKKNTAGSGANFAVREDLLSQSPPSSQRGRKRSNKDTNAKLHLQGHSTNTIRERAKQKKRSR